MKKQEEQLNEKQKSIDLLIYDFNHRGLNPLTKRFRGLADIGMRPIEELKRNIAQLKKPNHHRYADLADGQINEIETWWKLGIELCLSIEKDIKNQISKHD